MIGYTYELGRVIEGVQLVDLTHHQFDENDFAGRIFTGEPPECPALIDGVVTDAPAAAKAVLAAEAQAAAQAAETSRQSSKPDALKHIENEFLTVCEQLTGSKERLGFDRLEQIITGLMATSPEQATAISLKLLTIDAAGKREGGLKWWDDLAWHGEVVP